VGNKSVSIGFKKQQKEVTRQPKGSKLKQQGKITLSERGKQRYIE
jgi:hypothetical protein